MPDFVIRECDDWMALDVDVLDPDASFPERLTSATY